MSLKAVAMRASAEHSPAETPMIGIGSGNGCDVPLPNQIQNRLAGRKFEDYSARDRREIEARFWTRVKKTDSCWLWTASVIGGNGVQHGQFKLPRICGRQGHIYAHRLSWILAYGPIPDGLHVCHRCDVPRCVRPEHLFLGSQQDNLADARAKGRLNERLPRTATLTPEDRLAIYHMPNRRGLGVELALRYGVSKACISAIRRGKFVCAPMDRVFTRVPCRVVLIRGELTFQSVAALAEGRQLSRHLDQQRRHAGV